MFKDMQFNISSALIAVCFSFFLFPFSIYYNGTGISANYSFIFLALAILLVSKKIVLPSKLVLATMLSFTVILAWSLAREGSLNYFSVRRILSFGSLMTMFVFCFVELNQRLLKIFKVTLVLFSLAFAAFKISTFIYFGGRDLGYHAKDIVGSSREGFVYIGAIAVLLMQTPTNQRSLYLKTIVLAVLTIGAFLTFSRTTVVSGVVAFIAVLAGLYFGKTQIKFTKPYLFSGALFLSIIFLWHWLFPNVFNFYLDTFLGLLLDKEALKTELISSKHSLGYRVNNTIEWLEVVLNSPLTGTGFLGVWARSPDQIGSAHSQYLDVLYKTGFICFSLYLLAITRILVWSAKEEFGLFLVMLGCLATGFFHESFKESHGAFILAFILGINELSIRNRKNDRRS